MSSRPSRRSSPGAGAAAERYYVPLASSRIRWRRSARPGLYRRRRADEVIGAIARQTDRDRRHQRAGAQLGLDQEARDQRRTGTGGDGLGKHQELGKAGRRWWRRHGRARLSEPMPPRVAVPALHEQRHVGEVLRPGTPKIHVRQRRGRPSLRPPADTRRRCSPHRPGTYVPADKGYDADPIRRTIRPAGAVPVIRGCEGA
jgi:hypothetical protein